MSWPTVNDHILVADMPDWAEPVRAERVWGVDVETAMSGRESRVGKRQRAAWRLRYLLRPVETASAQNWLARLHAIARTGRAAVPAWGLGVPVVSISGADVTLAAAPWPWLNAGDPVWLAAPDRGAPGQLLQVQSITGNVIRCTAPPSSVPDGAMCWPVLFGRLGTERLEWVTDSIVACRVEFSERPPRDYWVPVRINPEACAPLYRSYALAGPLANADACQPPNASVSGTTFDGYAEGLYKPPTNTMQVAGRGITGIYIGDYSAGWPMGTTFDCLPEGPVLLIAAGSGITEVFAGEGVFNMPRLMDFAEEPLGDYVPGARVVAGYTQTFAS
jgi:hypothetical protein